MRSVIYQVNYFAIFVLIVTLITMSLLTFGLLHDPPLEEQLKTTAQDTAQAPVRFGAINFDGASHILTIENVTIDNPPGFTPGPAMTFGKITLEVDSEDIGKHPLWGQTKRQFIITSARIENVRVFLQVLPDSANISALLSRVEVGASVKYHTKVGRMPVTVALGKIFAPKEFDIVTADGKTTRDASGPLKELGLINHDGGALVSEAVAGTMQAFGRSALTAAVKRNMLTGLNKKGLAEIASAFNPAEQVQNRFREMSRIMARRMAFVFNNL